MKKTLLARLERLERRQPEPVDADRSLEQVMAQLNIMGERMRAQPGWKEPTEEQKAATLREFTAMVETMRVERAA
jgi:hypothetical protein